MEVKFRKKTKTEWATLYIFVMPFVLSLLTDVLRFPDLIKYTIDVVWIGLLVAMLTRKNIQITPSVKSLLIISGLFFGLTLVGFLLNFQSILYYLWGIRNNARFFIYFFACIFFVNRKSVEYYLSFIDIVFWVNLPFVLYQFFVMGIAQDYLGGIFGTQKGCNAYTNILLIIVATKALLYCVSNKEKVLKCLIKCAVALLIAALAELKSFYLEFVIIVAMVMGFTKASYKKIWITVCAVIGVIVGIRIIGMLFPIFADWFTLENILKSASSKKGYTATNDMNRLTAVSMAMDGFLPDLHHKLFGLGLGNCDYASYDFLITPFYRTYHWLNYTWFSSAFLILETGLVGMGLYLFFFIQIFFTSWKMSKEETSMKTVHCRMSMICAVLCCFLFVLDSSLRTEAAFMMFFILALPFVYHNNKNAVDN